MSPVRLTDLLTGNNIAGIRFAFMPLLLWNVISGFLVLAPLYVIIAAVTKRLVFLMPLFLVIVLGQGLVLAVLGGLDLQREAGFYILEAVPAILSFLLAMRMQARLHLRHHLPTGYEK